MPQNIVLESDTAHGIMHDINTNAQRGYELVSLAVMPLGGSGGTGRLYVAAMKLPKS
jgi:hypothetical protein